MRAVLLRRLTRIVAGEQPFSVRIEPAKERTKGHG